MLPNFLIIGAEKAATTWLARCLAEHPSVFMPREKEIFFFSSRFERGLPWYEAYFREWSGEARLGEATPVYLSHPAAASRIRSTLGEIDLLVSLRQPVDRAYSAYWHNLRRGRISTDSTFEACVRADEQEIRSRGDYLPHLQRYLACFRRERLLVLLYEDIQHDGASIFRECLSYLGLGPFEPRALESRLNEGGTDVRLLSRPAHALRPRLREVALWAMERGVIPRSVAQRIIPGAQRAFERLAHGWGPRARPYVPLSADLRQELFEAYYVHQLDGLQELLGLDLSRWRVARDSAPPPAA